MWVFKIFLLCETSPKQISRQLVYRSKNKTAEIGNLILQYCKRSNDMKKTH